MVMQWIQSIRDTHQLTVSNGLTGKWVGVFQEALKAFNKLSADYTLGVTMTDAKDERNANVVLRSASGSAQVSYTHNNRTLSAKFDDRILHGRGFMFGEDFGPRSRKTGYDKVAVYLPADAPGATLDIMTALTVHELVHACGLDNDDHAEDGLFYFPLHVLNGKLIVPEQGKNLKPLPPLWLAGSTIKKIKTWWIGLIDMDVGDYPRHLNANVGRSAKKR